MPGARGEHSAPLCSLAPVRCRNPDPPGPAPGRLPPPDHQAPAVNHAPTTIPPERFNRTLGRGGSDTSAVALAVALGAEKVEFYKDVPGICTVDPHRLPQAKVISSLTYQDALAIVGRGAEVLHARAIRLAEKNKLLLHVLSFIEEGEGTKIGNAGSHSRVVDAVYEV